MLLKLLEKVFLFSRKISFVEKGHDLKKIRYRVLPTQNNEVFINSIHAIWGAGSGGMFVIINCVWLTFKR